MKIFISYSHFNEQELNNLLKTNALVKNLEGIWYDRKMNGGDEWNNSIELELNDADVVLLLISQKYLKSNACNKEKDYAKNLSDKKGIKIISIILEKCDWKNDTWLSDRLAIPTDGKAIQDFENPELFYEDVNKWLEKSLDEYLTRKNISNSSDFLNFLDSTDILTNSHHSVRNLQLSDIFVFPPIEYLRTDKGYQKLEKEDFFSSLFERKKITIKGDNQAGKTSLCKEIYKDLRSKNFIPIYVDCDKYKEGTPENLLKQNFEKQYNNSVFQSFSPKYVVPIFDNFHNLPKKERTIEYLGRFDFSVLIIDEVFDLSLNSQNILKDYNLYKIRPFNAFKRNELLQLWLELDENFKFKTPVEKQREIDHYDNMLESTLGKVFGKGIIPAYPFFILSILSSFFSAKPLDTEITTQGYCYQSLIYFYLRKYGASNEIIDATTNFLSELAFKIYATKKDGLMEDEFDLFIKNYRKQFNLPISNDELLKMLKETNIATFDTLFNYSFTYNYIYYFFVAKHFSDNIREKEIREEIKNIVEAIYIEKNAMITIFIGHHSKSDILLDELILQSQFVFEESLESTLSKDELDFFDKNEKLIIDAVLPAVNENISDNRKKLLQKKSEQEEKEELDNSLPQNNSKNLDSVPTNDDDIKFLNELRLAYRTGEVLGTIIKNRSGSLEKDKLNMIYDSIFRMYMRLAGTFIELIRNEELERDFIEFLVYQTTQKITEERKENTSATTGEAQTTKHIEKLAKAIYWNINFTVIYSLIHRTIDSLGSSYLLEISDNYKLENSSSASKVTHYGIKMKYAKNLDLNEGEKFLHDNENSFTAKTILKQLVANYCKFNKIEERKLQAIESKFGISKRKILVEYKKEHR